MSDVTRKPLVMGGQYRLAGTRMPVTQVKRMIADPDGGREWVKANYPWITDEQIGTALAFRSAARRQEGSEIDAALAQGGEGE